MAKNATPINPLRGQTLCILFILIGGAVPKVMMDIIKTSLCLVPCGKIKPSSQNSEHKHQRAAGWFSIPIIQIGLTLIVDASRNARIVVQRACSSDNDEQLEEHWCFEWKPGNLLRSFTVIMVFHIQNNKSFKHVFLDVTVMYLWLEEPLIGKVIYCIDRGIFFHADHTHTLVWKHTYLN